MNYNRDYDIICFSNDLGLNLQQVSELYAELINEFNLALSELKISITKNDLANIQKIIHNLKGLSGNYRITDVYEETTKINNLLKNSNYNNIEPHLSNLLTVISIALKKIRNFFYQRSILI
ncbi:Hpt domain-containing protein [Clostridium beijerinckii]|uniref:Hpt domain-containing protein n=1 Tax=Clostridium beijerinckii TaxID=1520 RepID=UPI0022E4D1EE|nr:Hpt domain-containing protein [Clostridium beijerinckii]